MGGGQRGLEFLDAALDEALLLARGVVLGVFLQVAVRARLGDGLDDARALLALEAFQFLAQALGALLGHGSTIHASSSLCSSCRLCTLPPSRLSSECSSARAPAMVVEYVTRCCSASRRMENESAIACLPSVVLTM